MPRRVFAYCWSSLSSPPSRHNSVAVSGACIAHFTHTRVLNRGTQQDNANARLDDPVTDFTDRDRKRAQSRTGFNLIFCILGIVVLITTIALLFVGLTVGAAASA